MKIIINEVQFEHIKNEILNEDLVKNQIKDTQLRLNQLGANLTVNGIYDNSTKEAIQNFQKVNHFPTHHQTGGLDEKTKNLLFNVMNKPISIQSSHTNLLPIETPEIYKNKINNYVEIIKRIVTAPNQNGINYLHNLYKWFYENNIGIIYSIEDLYNRKIGRSVTGDLFYISTHDKNFKNNQILKKLIYYGEVDMSKQKDKKYQPLKISFPPKNIDNFDLSIINNATPSQVKQTKPKSNVPYHNCSDKDFPYEYGCQNIPIIGEIQKLLGIKPTGNYGPLTYKALSKFSKNLRATGITRGLYSKIKFSTKDYNPNPAEVVNTQ